MNTMTSINTHFALNTSKQLVAMSSYLSIHKSAKAVLAAIVAHFDVSNQYAYIKQETIAKKCSLSLSQTKRWIKRLTELKLIDKHNTFVFNENCGREVFGVNQYVPNIDSWKKMLAEQKISSNYKRKSERTEKTTKNKDLSEKVTLGNDTTIHIDISNKKNNKSNDVKLISFSSLKAFFSKKAEKTWLDYKTGLVFATYKDFMQKINVVGFISRFKRAKLAAEMIEVENISIENINAALIEEYETYKNKKNKKINTSYVFVKSEQYSFKYTDKHNKKFYFESKESFEAFKKAFTHC